ncbi:coiled-coil domain-containing protein 178-like [Liolophura sinensis]|uniref:coiled-coil domain-containing protein 178-like n=1 Tax=Liolophura sinensis TaxID=3198878 RepID=UPI0031598004
MAASNKVVRIEDVESRHMPERVRFKEETFVFSEDGGRASKLHCNLSSSSIVALPSIRPRSESFADPVHEEEEVASKQEQLTEDVSHDGDVQLEEHDTLGPLPANWPRVPALQRRRSCELSNIMYPCVNKAVSHLELVQSIIEEWFRRGEEDSASRQSSRMSSRQTSCSGGSPSRQTLKFGTDESTVEEFAASRRKSQTLSASSRSSGDSDSKTDLSILGIGGKVEKADESVEEKSAGDVIHEAEADVPYLGAEDVIEEVMTLLARLDNDRQLTEEKLKNEKSKVQNLEDRMEALGMKRLVDLPELVQQEHEACILDVNELQWHVAYSSRSEDRIRNKTNIAEVLNKRLKEDIAFVDKHIPLVQEKLELELSAMEKIRLAQLETNKELELTLTRQAKTESKSREANQKAESERALIRKELGAVRNELSAISNELADAERAFNTYTHQANDITQHLKQNQQEKSVLEVRNENAKYAEEMQAAKVRELDTLITEAEFEHRRLTNENQQLQQDLDLRKADNARQISEMHIKKKKKEKNLRRMTIKNKEVDMEIQDAEDKIAKCEKQRKSDERNIARLKKDMVRTEQQMEVIIEDHQRVFTINTALREQLAGEEEKAVKLEESLKQTMDTLRRQVKDEVHTRTVLQARISSDTSDVSKSSAETLEKKEKVSVVANDVTVAVSQVEDKVTRLRSAQESKLKKIEELKRQIEETVEKEKNTEKEIEEQLKICEPHHRHLKEDMLASDKKLDHMTWKTELMTKNMEDMDASSSMMVRVLDKTEKSTQLLHGEYEELKIQLQTGEKMRDALKESMNVIEERIFNLDNQQKKFIADRKNCLENLEDQKQQCLTQNKNLASKYRQLQNKFVLAKNELLDEYENRIKLENTIKDLKQLRSLQLRMHAALVEYFKFRGLYNEAEVEKLETESSENGFKVMELQTNMNKALSSITRFLQTELGGKTNQALLPTVTPPSKGMTPPQAARS